MCTQPQPPALIFYQQPCSSNTVFFSLPQPSLQPSACGAQTTTPLESNANVQNWVVKPVHPITYEAVASSHGTSNVSSIFHSTWSDSFAHPFLPNEIPLSVLPNQTKTHKPMQYEVCKIDCSSKGVFEEHISGKKHKRDMQLQNNPTTTILSGTSDIQMNSVQGKGLLSGDAAVDCNSQEAFSEHLAGKMHADQVGLTSKKMKVAQPVRCEVCNIHCNSKDVYISHSFGKKHLKKLEKLSKSKNAGDGDGVGATAAIVTTNATNQEIEPQEKTDTRKLEEGINSHKLGNAVKLEAVEEDIKTRKQKLKGAAATCVKWCTLCNVMCNNETNFQSHLSGRKHAAMVKKQQSQVKG